VNGEGAQIYGTPTPFIFVYQSCPETARSLRGLVSLQVGRGIVSTGVMIREC